MSNFALKIPDDLKAEATQLAEEAGISLNQFINNAIVSKVATQKETALFFKTRTSRATSGENRLKSLLNKAGIDIEPLPEDR